MVSRIAHFKPSIFEFVGLSFVGFFVMILSNSQQLLQYYGLTSSGQLVKNGVGGAVSHGLGKLDNFSITASAVTFAIWAVVGMLCFSIVRALARVYQEVELDAELSSNRYIHPSTFKRGDFWRQVTEDFALLLISLLIFGAVLVVFVSVVLPASIAYGRDFLSDVSIIRLGDFLLGLVLLYVGLIVVDIALRLVLFHRQFLPKR